MLTFLLNYKSGSGQKEVNTVHFTYIFMSSSASRDDELEKRSVTVAKMPPRSGFQMVSRVAMGN